MVYWTEYEISKTICKEIHDTCSNSKILKTIEYKR